MKKIGIIDYGMGNLHSVCGALNHIGLANTVSSDISALEKCDALILPGVGAFPDAMRALDDGGLTDFIRAQARIKPLLGICLGMQLLFTRSFEFGDTAGLNLIGGEVVPITAYKNSREYKTPHMGWNSLDIIRPCALTKGLPDKVYVYFVHSYKAVCDDASTLCASADYGEQITAITSSGNVYGTQFHPEKSEESGLTILKNFSSLM